MTDQLSVTPSGMVELKALVALLSTQIEGQIRTLEGQVRVGQALLKVDQDLARAGILALTDNDRDLTFNYLRQIAGDDQTSHG